MVAGPSSTANVTVRHLHCHLCFADIYKDKSKSHFAMEETMRHFSTIAIAALAALFLTVAPTLAANKFKNEDTAKNRKDHTWGTEQTEERSTTTFGKDEDGNTIIRSKPEEKEEVDWYEKLDGLNPETNILIDPKDY